MARDRKFVGMLKRQMFKSGGRYFQREERLAKGKEEKRQTKMEMKKQKKDWKMVEDSLVLYKNAMEKTGHLPPVERAKVLKKVEGIIFERVKKTYNDNVEKQSLAHQKLYEMTAHLAMERMRLKK